MHTFRPADVDLATSTGADDRFGQIAAAGAPVTQTGTRIASSDGGLLSGVWESWAGTADYRFTVDEWAYILEGEAQVTAAGITHVLRAGDVFYTPAGERMTWLVPIYVRKVWVHRRPPLIGRIRRKVARIVRGRSGT